MLYNKREKLTKPFDDPNYTSGYNNGIFLFKYHYDSSTDLFFKDRMYDNIRVQVANSKYFILENISTDIMTLQRITFMQDDVSFIRTIMKEGYTSSDFDGTYNRDGYIYSDWELESLKENDLEVKRVLDTASKSSMHERLVSKNDSEYNKLFKYKKRITVSELNNTLENGVYSVIDDLETLFTLMPMKREILRARSNSKTSQDTILEGVLENYITENHIFQTLYISSPIVSNMNRFYNRSRSKWSEWRINQNVDDTYWLHNAIPISNYVDIPIIKRQLGINSTMLIYGNNGTVDNNVFPGNISEYSSNKTNSFRMNRNVFYKVGSKYPVDMVYGYNSVRSINESERTLVEHPTERYDASLVASSIGRTSLDHWTGRTAYVSYDIAPSNTGDNWFRQWNMYNTGANPGFQSNSILDKGNDGKTESIPAFSYINGLSIFWSSDVMHFDIKQGILIDYNTRKDTI